MEAGRRGRAAGSAGRPRPHAPGPAAPPFGAVGAREAGGGEVSRSETGPVPAEPASRPQPGGFDHTAHFRDKGRGLMLTPGGRIPQTRGSRRSDPVARVRIMYWKQIPYGVRAQDESGQVTRPLPPAFQEAIDSLAMLIGATAAEDYQAGFRWGPTEERPGGAAEAADAMVAVTVAEYPGTRLKSMARSPE